MDCIFCKIVKGEIDSAKVYEDEDTLAFLDVYPDSLGHTLVIPKVHHADMFEMPDDLLGKTTIIAKKVAARLKDSLHTDGILFKQSSGSAAGQVIFHYHIHLIPRYSQDDQKPDKPEMAEFKKLAEKLKIA